MPAECLMTALPKKRCRTGKLCSNIDSTIRSVHFHSCFPRAHCPPTPFSTSSCTPWRLRLGKVSPGGCYAQFFMFIIHLSYVSALIRFYHMSSYFVIFLMRFIRVSHIDYILLICLACASHMRLRWFSYVSHVRLITFM